VLLAIGLACHPSEQQATEATDESSSTTVGVFVPHDLGPDPPPRHTDCVGFICPDPNADPDDECDIWAQDVTAIDPDAACPGAAAGQVCAPWYEIGHAPPGFVDVGACVVPQ
jgi:hypothetical protein